MKDNYVEPPSLLPAGDTVSRLYQKLRGQTPGTLTIPNTPHNLRRVQTACSLFSNLFQAALYHSHTPFEIQTLVEPFEESPPAALHALPKTEAERLLLLSNALFLCASEQGWDFIDFSRFQLIPSRTSNTAAGETGIRFPLSLDTPVHPQANPLPDIFKAHKRFRRLEEQDLPALVSQLMGRYTFSSRRDYLYNSESVTTALLEAYPPETLARQGHVKIAIHVDDPVHETLIRLNLYRIYLGGAVFFLDTTGCPGPLSQRLAQYLPEGAAPGSGDVRHILRSFYYYIRQSPFSSLVLVVEPQRLTRPGDAAFLEDLLHHPGFGGILLVVPGTPAQLAEGTELADIHSPRFDLRLNRSPVNLLADRLSFASGAQPAPTAVSLSPKELRCLKTLASFPFPVPYDAAWLAARLPGISMDLLESLKQKKTLALRAGKLSVADGTSSRTNVCPEADEKSRMLGRCLDDPDTAPLLPLAAAMEYYLHTRRTAHLTRFLENRTDPAGDGQPDEHGTEIDAVYIKDILRRYMQVLETDLHCLQRVVEFLVRENHLETAETLIQRNTPRAPLFFMLKNAQVHRYKRDYNGMWKLLQAVEPHVPRRGPAADEFYYLNYIYHEKVTPSQDGLSYLKKIKSPLFRHLAALKQVDHRVYRRRPGKEEEVLKGAEHFLRRAGYHRDALWAQNQWGKILREQKAAGRAEQAYKQCYLACELRRFTLMGAYVASDLGNLYYGMEDFARAGTWYNKALEGFEKQGNENGKMLATANLAEICRHNGQWGRVEKYLKAALAYDTKHHLMESLGVDYFNIAELEYLKHNIPGAARYLARAVHVFEEKKNFTYLVECSLLEIRLYLLGRRRGGAGAGPGVPDKVCRFLSRNRDRLDPDQRVLLSWYRELCGHKDNKNQRNNKKKNSNKGDIDNIDSKDYTKLVHGVRREAPSFASRTRAFEAVAALFAGLGEEDLLEPLRDLSQLLCMEGENYYYYEYYYLYFDFLLKAGEDPAAAGPELFRDVFDFFSRSKRNFTAHFAGAGRRLDKWEDNDAAQSAAGAGKVCDHRGRYGSPRSRELSPEVIKERLRFIVGESPAMEELKYRMAKVSGVDFPVLITGESGTGKDLVAVGVHNLSKRAGGPFVPVNSAAIPEALMEAELFGCKKGAFTGADQDRQGVIRSAQGGSLFLDEIADLSLNLQAKLLRALNDRKIRPLGETRAVSVDFRLITATNKDLERMIEENLFRADLYYRICPIPLAVPPLRERHGDIPLLVRYFFKKHGLDIEGDAEWRRIEELFTRRSWSGNVRELESAVKQAITFYPDLHFMEDRSPGGGTAKAAAPDGLVAARDHYERSMVRDALRRNQWHLSNTARELKVTRQFLSRLIKKYGLMEEE